MIKVKNLKGTSDRVPPDGSNTWLDFWTNKTGRKPGYCLNAKCYNQAEVGAHVIKADSTDKSWYIVPLCKACNGSDEEFYVNESDLVKIY